MSKVEELTKLVLQAIATGEFPKDSIRDFIRRNYIDSRSWNSKSIVDCLFDIVWKTIPPTGYIGLITLESYDDYWGHTEYILPVRNLFKWKQLSFDLNRFLPALRIRAYVKLRDSNETNITDEKIDGILPILTDREKEELSNLQWEITKDSKTAMTTMLEVKKDDILDFFQWKYHCQPILQPLIPELTRSYAIGLDELPPYDVTIDLKWIDDLRAAEKKVQDFNRMIRKYILSPNASISKYPDLKQQIATNILNSLRSDEKGIPSKLSQYEIKALFSLFNKNQIGDLRGLSLSQIRARLRSTILEIGEVNFPLLLSDSLRTFLIDIGNNPHSELIRLFDTIRSLSTVPEDVRSDYADIFTLTMFEVLHKEYGWIVVPDCDFEGCHHPGVFNNNGRFLCKRHLFA